MAPLQMLEMVGHQVDVISPGKKRGDTVKTAIHDFGDEQTYIELHGHKFKITADFDSVNPQNYHALYIPGGRAPEHLRTVDRVLQIVQHFLDEKKPLGAICHGPQILSAIPGALKGRRITAYTALKTDMTNAGAVWVGDCAVDDAVVDGNLVTGVAWPGHPKFMAEFMKLLGTRFEL